MQDFRILVPESQSHPRLEELFISKGYAGISVILGQDRCCQPPIKPPSESWADTPKPVIVHSTLVYLRSDVWREGGPDTHKQARPRHPVPVPTFRHSGLKGSLVVHLVTKKRICFI